MGRVGAREIVAEEEPVLQVCLRQAMFVSESRAFVKSVDWGILTYSKRPAKPLGTQPSGDVLFFLWKW